ncbi:DUF3649 domain-containing protein [Stenotrophomonas sp. MMGLT7]|uniref:DUF3649 domain-containing protein n=1 Tax=Stenotrophomonas sp. MMGLT7 TaxID=2901227 RepID=UPI001E2EF654|nr:DUF3649 domain-containing protein [Stenotrophomonas sp. MMGLT7]MCD7099630.1 DUF3649 domain-containing protein [Stenotrophomonas sp. MMGLT7]
MTDIAPNAATQPRWRSRLSRPWLGVLSRVLAAIFGGYALASSASVLMALALPMPRSQAVLTGMLAGIALAACAALWAFASERAWKAWAGIAGPALAMALAAHWLGAAA